MKRFLAAAAIAALGAGCAAPAGADTLTMNLTADNQFAVYVSTSDSALGAFVGSGNDWGRPTRSPTPSREAPITSTSSQPTGRLRTICGVRRRRSTEPATTPTASSARSPSPAARSPTAPRRSRTDTTHWKASEAGAYPYATIPTAWTGATGAPQSYGLNGVGPWGGRPERRGERRVDLVGSRQRPVRRILHDVHRRPRTVRPGRWRSPASRRSVSPPFGRLAGRRSQSWSDSVGGKGTTGPLLSGRPRQAVRTSCGAPGAPIRRISHSSATPLVSSTRRRTSSPSASRSAAVAGAAVDEEIAVHGRDLRVADDEPAAAGAVDQLPGLGARRVLEGRAAGLFPDRLRGLARAGDALHLGQDRARDRPAGPETSRG